VEIIKLVNSFSPGFSLMDEFIDEYFELEKIRSFCKEDCRNYNKLWSCPEYSFDELTFLRQYKYMLVIGSKYYFSDEEREQHKNDPQEYCIDVLWRGRCMMQKKLLAFEAETKDYNTMTLIPGSCPLCEEKNIPCTRPENKPCRYPDEMRYSLESMGFYASRISQYDLGIELKWSVDDLPEYMVMLSGIMCEKPVPKEIIRKYFPEEEILK
jgi:predicted metal-binding protein